VSTIFRVASNESIQTIRHNILLPNLQKKLHHIIKQ